MRQKAVEQPFPVGHKVVHIEPLEESCQVLVKGFPSDQDYAVQMYLDRFQDSIESIERKSEDVFIVTFKKYEGKIYCWVFMCNNNVISVMLFSDF